MQLSKQQIQFFETFGYLCVRGLFAAQEMDWITEEFEISIRKFGGGEQHDGKQRTMFGGPIEHTAKMCTLLDDARIRGFIGGVIGEDFNYCSGDGNYYTGDTAWHPDGNWGQLFAAKVAFYLDAVTRDTGCLRVIPGSHRPDHWIRSQGIDPNRAQEMFGVAPRDFPGNVALKTEPGDLLMFNHDLYHASFGGGSQRRMFTMNCTRHATTPEDMELCRRYISVHSAGGYNVDTGAGMYFPLMLDTADYERMKHLSQPAQVHDELFPQFARHTASLQGESGQGGQTSHDPL